MAVNGGATAFSFLYTGALLNKQFDEGLPPAFS